MPDVLLSAPYLIPTRSRFADFFAHYGMNILVPEVHERLEEHEILAWAGQFDAALCGDDRFTEKAIRACLPRLKVISKWGTGIDSIDRLAAQRLGVQVRNTPNAFTLPVADSVLAYMLAFARRQPWMDRAVKAGVWEKIPGYSLSEQTLGVIGVGNCGKAVIRRAKAFGMHILATDIAPVASDFLAETHIEMTTLADLLARSDYVSVNCDLNPTSRHLMNAEAFAQMKPGAVLINTARGPIVEETALVEALELRKIAGAGLDVFEIEPLPANSPLREMDQVMLGSHNANSSPAAWERVHLSTMRNLVDGLGLSMEGFNEAYPWP